MTSKQKKNLYIIICILFCIIYFFTAATPIKEHLHLQPVWTIDITENIPDSNGTQPNVGFTHHFKLGQNIGYYNKDGTIGLFKTYPFKASISDNYWTIYTSNVNSIHCNTPQDNASITINTTGFPFFDDDRIYVFHPSGNSFSAYNTEGICVWSHDEPAIITAFNSSQNGTVAGYSNGKIFYTDSSNSHSATFAPGGSNYNVILGIAISPNGEYVAALSGIDKQRILIAKIENRQTKIIFHTFLSTETKNQSFVYFSNDNNTVFFSTKQQLVLVSIKTLEATFLKLDGTVLNIVECSPSNTSKTSIIYAVLSKIDTGYQISLINENAIKLAEFSFNADHTFIASENNSFFVGKDTSISRIDLINK